MTDEQEAEASGVSGPSVRHSFGSVSSRSLTLLVPPATRPFTSRLGPEERREAGLPAGTRVPESS